MQLEKMLSLPVVVSYHLDFFCLEYPAMISSAMQSNTDPHNQPQTVGDIVS